MSTHRLQDRRQTDLNLTNTFDLLRIILAIVLMLIGQVDPEERLVFYGVSFNTTIYFFAAAIALLQPKGIAFAVLCLTIFTPIHILLITLAWSPNPTYGFWKYSNIVAIVVTCLVLVLPIIERDGWRKFSKVWVNISLILLALAFVTKLNSGLFDRNTPFFINGPIVFARIMGIAMFLSLVVYTGKMRLLLTTLFALAVFWTASRGPILFMVTTLGIYLAINGALKSIILVTLVGILALFLALENIELFFGNSFGRLIETYNYVIHSGPIPASIETRVGMVTYSLNLILDNPIGVGLGGWAISPASVQPWPYPHNIYLEIFSEAGLLLGLIALIPFSYFLFRPSSPFFFAALFMLLCQQSSGDMLDARYLLFLSTLAIIIPENFKSTMKKNYIAKKNAKTT